MSSLKKIISMMIMTVALALPSIHCIAGPISFFREASPGELLRDAAFVGDLKGISHWLNKGVSVDWTHPLGEGWTPLMWAIHERQHKAVKLLLQKGAAVNARDKLGCTPLYWAALDGDSEMIELLLAHGASVDIAERKRGWDPLMRASYMGHNSVVKLLLDKGANPNRTDKWGNTALTLASFKKNRQTATLLVARGAVPDSKTRQKLAALDGNSVTVQTTEHIKIIRYSSGAQNGSITRTNDNAAKITLIKTKDGSFHSELHSGNPRAHGSYNGTRQNAPIVDLSVSPLIGTDAIGPDVKSAAAFDSGIKGLHKREKAERLIQKAISIWNQLQREYPGLAAELLREAHKKTSNKQVLTQYQPVN